MLLALVVAGGLRLYRPEEEPRAPSAERAARSTPEPSPEPPAYELDFRRRLHAVAVAGEVRRRRLRDAARAVERVMTDLYETAFVDPERWRDGRFPTLFASFAGPARRSAHRDLGKLTLGRAAQHLSAVRPRRARLDVRFLLSARRRPVAALAEVEFEGIGLAPGVEVRLRNEGRYVLRRVARRWRVVSYDVRGRVPTPGAIRRAKRQARFSPELRSRGLLFVLAIGSDARLGQSVTRSRADSLHIIGVNPRRRAVSILGIPRDSFVPIPGHGVNKINAALVYGGPELMVRTVEQLTGIHIDAYVLTGFADFTRMVSMVGGVEVDVPYPMSDPYARAYFRPGRTRMNGREALAFSRNRHDGPSGDVGRSLNQGRVIVAALSELRSDLRRDPLTLFRWAVAGARHLWTDLSLEQMLELLMATPSIEPGRVRNRVVPGSGGMVGGQSVIHLGGAAHAMFRDLARDAILSG